MKTQLKIASILVLAFVLPLAHAGLIEELLAVPAIQSMLGRQPELQAMVQRCSDLRYQQRNPKLCQQADDVSRLARVPPELRTLLSNPVTAASIREICIAVQGKPVENSYLCSELIKADTGFRLRVDQQRQTNEQQNREQPR